MMSETLRMFFIVCVRPENQNEKRMMELKKKELKFRDSIEENHEMSFGVCVCVCSPVFFSVVVQKRLRYKMVGLHDIFDPVMLPQLIHNVHYKLNGIRFSSSFFSLIFLFGFLFIQTEKHKKFKR